MVHEARGRTLDVVIVVGSRVSGSAGHHSSRGSCNLSKVEQTFWFISQKGWVCVHVRFRAPSDLGKAIQIEVSLKGAELLGAKVLREDRVGEFCHIKDAKGFSRIRPHNGTAGGEGSRCGRLLLGHFGFILEHLVKASRKLLRDTSLPSAGEAEGGEWTFRVEHGQRMVTLDCFLLGVRRSLLWRLMAREKCVLLWIVDYFAFYFLVSSLLPSLDGSEGAYPPQS
mmetsp:Transcript_14653/g.30253  ORF Transcript_14653/g.30253 Transcript_14653/m.30253 type:complete len:225 (-) Transcript_14653:8-682(-)